MSYANEAQLGCIHAYLHVEKSSGRCFFGRTCRLHAHKEMAEGRRSSRNSKRHAALGCSNAKEEKRPGRWPSGLQDLLLVPLLTIRWLVQRLQSWPRRAAREHSTGGRLRTWSPCGAWNFHKWEPYKEHAKFGGRSTSRST